MNEIINEPQETEKDQEKSFPFRNYLFKGLIVIIIIASFAGGYIFALYQTRLLNLPLSSFVLQTVQKEFVEPYTDQMLARGIVFGTGDPFSAYMTKEEYQSFETQLSERYVGIGVLISDQQGRLVIIKVFPDSPAEMGGVKPNMEIRKVDDHTVYMQGLENAATLIRGRAGTQVKLTVLEEEEKKELVLTRDYVTIPTIESQLHEDDIAIIRILSFNFGTAKQFKDHFNKMVQKDPKAIVLDMRDNSGGVLEETIDIAEFFLPSRAVLLQSKDRSGKIRELKIGSSRARDIPLFLLVNRHSASAVEVLAGAVQDHQAGLILGEQTFGKASIQKIFHVPFEGSAVKLTVQRYLTPSGRNIDRNGIVPDVEIMDVPRYSPEGVDMPLQEALNFIREHN